MILDIGEKDENSCVVTLEKTHKVWGTTKIMRISCDTSRKRMIQFQDFIIDADYDGDTPPDQRIFLIVLLRKLAPNLKLWEAKDIVWSMLFME